MKRETVSLKVKIIRYTLVVMILAMAISTIGAYIYFTNMVRTQALRDEEAKLNQFAAQMEFMVDDIAAFSKNIMVDPQVQEVLYKEHYPSEIDKARANTRVSEQLKFYNTLRNYIAITSMMDQYDRGYSSNGLSSARYFEEKFKSTELLEYTTASDMVFSRPYSAREMEIKERVLCYKAPVHDWTRNGNIVGTIYMEIYFSYFEKQIEQYASNYEKVVWCIKDGQVLYDSDPSVFSSGIAAIPSTELQPVMKITGGYRVSRYIEGTDWFLCSFVSDGYLRSQSVHVLIFFLLFFVCTILIMLISINPVVDSIVRPITNLTRIMELAHEKEFRIDTGDSDILSSEGREGGLPIHEIQKLNQSFTEMMKEIDRYTKEIVQHEKLVRSMEFDILLSQINPHYLYNVLNTVVYLAADAGNNDIVKLVNALIKTLQESLKIGENSVYTTVRKEIEVVKSYLTIQDYRYPDAAEVIWQIDETLNECQIPKTMIQPLVENALIHGLLPTGEPGHIWIRVSEENSKLIVEVEDDGIGMTATATEQFYAGKEPADSGRGRKHIGLGNIRARVLYLYKDNAGADILTGKTGTGTIVKIVLPKIL